MPLGMTFAEEAEEGDAPEDEERCDDCREPITACLCCPDCGGYGDNDPPGSCGGGCDFCPPSRVCSTCKGTGQVRR